MERNVKLVYCLSTEGQKKLLREGGNGHQKQVIEIQCTEELLKTATVTSDGELIIYYEGQYGSAQTAETLIKQCPYRHPIVILCWHIEKLLQKMNLGR